MIDNPKPLSASFQKGFQQMPLIYQPVEYRFIYGNIIKVMGAIHKLHPSNTAPLEMRQSSLLCYQDFLQLQSPVPHWTRITIFDQKSEVKFDYTTK